MNPIHIKVHQQLDWLYHQDGTAFQNQELAVHYLTRSLEADPAATQSWYLLGCTFMAGQKYNKAYQQAVYHNSCNPTFWCSTGVLMTCTMVISVMHIVEMMLAVAHVVKLRFFLTIRHQLGLDAWTFGRLHHDHSVLEKLSRTGTMLAF
ncbi:hypothetical protein FISHEDRAFT_59575 [Fistulina hepatica ATCC 64428]|uniref:TPR-like protein n=1 Tax=Fistulina hepatica ATCC 64428 TaxID=1128425 RepID=A0A0D7AAA0_9AGAR|nr:hypothetical protein FISHEDRAFT_59575 [Fistulina hepatica ATCC 64428]